MHRQQERNGGSSRTQSPITEPQHPGAPSTSSRHHISAVHHPSPPPTSFSVYSSSQDSGRHLTQEQLRALYEEQKNRQPHNPRQRDMPHHGRRCVRASSEPPLPATAATALSSSDRPSQTPCAGDAQSSLNHKQAGGAQPCHQTTAAGAADASNACTRARLASGANAPLGCSAEHAARSGQDRGRDCSPELLPTVLRQGPRPSTPPRCPHSQSGQHIDVPPSAFFHHAAAPSLAQMPARTFLPAHLVSPPLRHRDASGRSPQSGGAPCRERRPMAQLSRGMMVAVARAPPPREDKLTPAKRSPQTRVPGGSDAPQHQRTSHDGPASTHVNAPQPARDLVDQVLARSLQRIEILCRASIPRVHVLVPCLRA